MFKVGDKIVYPTHGAGVIETIEERKVLKEKQDYYIMRMPVGEIVLMIPVKNAEEIGIRSIVDNKTAKKVVATFGAAIGEVNENWNKRYRENMQKIRTGDIYEVLEVVKMLMLRDRTKGLSTGERKMLNNAKHILLSELDLTDNYEYKQLEAVLCKEIDILCVEYAQADK